jgi:hypothetical protein
VRSASKLLERRRKSIRQIRGSSSTTSKIRQCSELSASERPDEMSLFMAFLQLPSSYGMVLPMKLSGPPFCTTKLGRGSSRVSWKTDGFLFLGGPPFPWRSLCINGRQRHPQLRYRHGQNLLFKNLSRKRRHQICSYLFCYYGTQSQEQTCSPNRALTMKKR